MRAEVTHSQKVRITGLRLCYTDTVAESQKSKKTLLTKINFSIRADFPPFDKANLIYS